MIVELCNVWAVVMRATPAEFAWLRDTVWVPDIKARFSGAAPRKTLLQGSKFPAGLLSVVVERAAKCGVEVQVLDRRVRPVPLPRPDLSWLTSFQLDAVEAALKATRGVLHCPTASGKSELIAALTRAIPGKHLVLTHRPTLASAIAERVLLRTGEECGLFDSRTQTEARVTCASLPTLLRRLALKDAKAWRLLLATTLHVDECQVAAGASFQKVLSRCDAFYRFGYSATPYARSDKRGVLVSAWLGPTVYRITTPEVVAAGTVAKASIQILPFTHSHPSETYTSWHTAYEAMIVRNDRRNAKLVALTRTSRGPRLVFVRSLEHGVALNALLRASGMRSLWVHGDTEASTRVSIARRLDSGKLDVVVASTVFQEGVNIPNLRTVIYAGGGKSHIAVLQSAGRGMRRLALDGSITKDHFTVLDVYDRGCCYLRGERGAASWTHSPCAWLHKHSAERRKAYLSEGFECSVIDVW